MSFDLERFVVAQDRIYDRVTAELAGGRKQSHWIWFIFPQIAGLGFSAMSQRFAIASLAEAQAYVSHPILGARLRECTALVLAIPEKSANAILGSPDDMKFHSSMTLFAHAAPGEPLFGNALDRFFDGAEDDATLTRL